MSRLAAKTAAAPEDAAAMAKVKHLNGKCMRLFVLNAA
jgi:hypothetical protein